MKGMPDDFTPAAHEYLRQHGMGLKPKPKKRKAQEPEEMTAVLGPKPKKNIHGKKKRAIVQDDLLFKDGT